MDKEDEESMKVRMEMEAKEKEELMRGLDEDEDSWRERKIRERALWDKKRGRPGDDDEGVPGVRRRSKRMRYGLLQEDWGEDDRNLGDAGRDDLGQEQQLPSPSQPPPPRGRKRTRSDHPSHLITPVITDYFQPRAKEVKMDPKGLELEFTEDDWFEEHTLDLVDLGTSERADTIGLSQQEDPHPDLPGWFTSLMDSFTTLEDPVVVLEPVERAGIIAPTAVVHDDHGQDEEQGEQKSKDDWLGSPPSERDQEEFEEMTTTMLDSSHPTRMTLSTPDILLPPEGQGRMREQEDSGKIQMSPRDPTDGVASIGSQGEPTAQQTEEAEINLVSDVSIPEADTDQRDMRVVEVTGQGIQGQADVPGSPVTRTGVSRGHVDGVMDGSMDLPDSTTVLPSVELPENLAGKPSNNPLVNPMCLVTPGRSRTEGSGPLMVSPHPDTIQGPDDRTIEDLPLSEEDIPPPPTTSTPVQGRGRLVARPCVHKKGGVCTIHGPGAKLKWRPSWVTIQGPDGVARREYERFYWYECDLMPGGRGGRARQSRLSLVKTTLLKTTPFRRQQGDNNDDAA